ncbi:MAG: hypothetical protein ACFBSD_11750 [Paracoccaceae bacterium]
MRASGTVAALGGLLAGLVGGLAAGLAGGLLASPAAAEARLIHLTDDGTPAGTPLLRGFGRPAVWQAVGVADGRVLLAVSARDGTTDTAALLAIDPETARPVVLDTLRAASNRVGNWLEGERQTQVNAFLHPGPGGTVWLGSFADTRGAGPGVAAPGAGRGGHLYARAPRADRLEDVTARLPYALTRDGALLRNPGRPGPRSGIVAAGEGIAGLAYNAAVPDTLYALAYPSGRILRIEPEAGRLQVLPELRAGHPLAHLDVEGDLYFTSPEDGGSTLSRLRGATAEPLARGLPPGGLTALAPRRDGRIVYGLLGTTSEIWGLDTRREKLLPAFRRRCGRGPARAEWRAMNLTLSADERHLFVVTAGPDAALWAISLSRRRCQRILPLDAVLEGRNVALGGYGAKDAAGRLYLAAWREGDGDGDLAVLRVDLPGE